MKRHLIILLLAGCFAATASFGAPAAGRAPGKYLFLVETSGSTANRAELTALAVADLIERGLGGRMQAGDLFTVIPFNEQVDLTGYARKAWEPNRSRHISNLVFLYLQKYKFEKKTRLDRVTSLIQGIVLSEREVTIYLVSSGEIPLQNTPFDAEVNAIYRQNLAQWQANKSIVVTALVAEKARLTEWAVGVAEPPAPVKLIARRALPQAQPKPEPTTNLATQLPVVTNLPPVQPKITNQVAKVITNAAPPIKPPATNKVEVVPPKPTTNQVVQANPPVTSPATNRPPEIKPEPPKLTNLVVAVPPKLTNQVTVTETSKPPVDVKPVGATNVPAPIEVAQTNAGVSTAAVAVVTQAPATNKPAVQPILALGPGAKGKPYGMLLAAAGFLALAAWLGYAWFRRTRPAAAPSLITQSFDRDRFDDSRK